MTVMERAIEDRRGEDIVAKDGAPLSDELVGGDQEAAAFVAAGDDWKTRWALRRSNGR